MLLLSKGIIGGIVAVLVVWTVTVVVYFMGRDVTTTGLGAVAGGWDMLLRSPLIALILTLAFGVGFRIMTRYLGT
jgi:hypothetical protein